VMTALGDTRSSGLESHVDQRSECIGRRRMGVLEMKTASGDVTTATVRESLTCHSARQRSCDGRTITKIRTARQRALSVESLDISVRTVSGNVAVSVARGLEVDVDATSIPVDSLDDALDGTTGARPRRRLDHAKTVSAT